MQDLSLSTQLFEISHIYHFTVAGEELKWEKVAQKGEIPQAREVHVFWYDSAKCVCVCVHVCVFAYIFVCECVCPYVHMYRRIGMLCKVKVM